ncbi:hypothetical protein R6Q59_022777 [Mikania micrantha]
MINGRPTCSFREENMNQHTICSRSSPLPFFTKLQPPRLNLMRLDIHPNNDDHISLHVVICDTGSDSKGWEVCVDVSFFVYDHTQNNYVTFQDVNGHRTRFHMKKTTWGFDKLISTESFMESENGYLFNDSCVFGAEIFEVPQFTRLDRCLLMTKPLPTMNIFTWTIKIFSSLTEEKLRSDAFKIGKVKWNLSLYPKGSGLGKGTHLSIFLGVHDAMSLPNGWKVFADCKFWIKNHFNNWFCNSNSTGFPTFMLLSKLIDGKNVFLLNDSLIVEVDYVRYAYFKKKLEIMWSLDTRSAQAFWGLKSNSKNGSFS